VSEYAGARTFPTALGEQGLLFVQRGRRDRRKSEMGTPLIVGIVGGLRSDATAPPPPLGKWPTIFPYIIGVLLEILLCISHWMVLGIPMEYSTA